MSKGGMCELGFELEVLDHHPWACWPRMWWRRGRGALKYLRQVGVDDIRYIGTYGVR